MNVRAKAVVSQHSILRDLFFPFYSLDVVIFSAALGGASYVLMLWWLDAPAAIVGTLGGCLGITVVNRSTKPSRMHIQKHQEAMLISLLERSRYRYVPDNDHWVPPLPRWLRWKTNFIKFSADGSVVRIVGPANILRRFAARIS